MSTWHLNSTPIATVGVANLVRELNNMATDRLTFDIPAEVTAAAAYAPDTAVTLYKDAAPFFTGRTARTPVSAQPNAHRHAVEILGPWDQLERTIYQQTWNSGPPVEADPEADPPILASVPTYTKSRVILGQDAEGNRQYVGEAIHDIIDYAAECGVAIAPGSISANVKILWDEALDITCADAIRRLARWVPDAVAWFDYSVSPPTFNFRRRAVLPAVSIPLLNTSESVSIGKTPSWNVPVVVLKIEKSNEAGGQSWENTDIQKYPEAEDEKQVGAIIQTMQLAGLRQNAQYQTVKLQTIPDIESAEADSAESRHWWETRHPELLQYAAGGGSYILHDGDRLLDAGDYPNELIEGSIQDWMLEDDEGILADEDTLTVHCSFIRKAAGIVVEKGEILLVERINATNIEPSSDLIVPAVSPDTAYGWKTFKRQRIEAAEEIPTDLAQRIYEAFNFTQWQGTLAVWNEDLAIALRPGLRLNVTGGQPDWSTMAAIVQQTTDYFDHGKGKTLIRCGPPTQLSPQGILDLIRANRNRRPAESYSARISGRSSDIFSVLLSSKRPLTAPSSLNLSSSYLALAPTPDPEYPDAPAGPPIILDPSSNPPDAQYKVFQVIGTGPAATTGFDWVRAHA